MLKNDRDVALHLKTLTKCLCEQVFSTSTRLPIYSIEGLPGSGKTTQVNAIIQHLGFSGLKGYPLELPTNSPFGIILKSLYQNKKAWPSVFRSCPWLNPLFIKADFYSKLEYIEPDDHSFILMSRGIVSTYTYNLPAFKSIPEGLIILDNLLLNFPYPELVFYIDVDINIALSRIIERNRQPLRENDTLDGLCEINALTKKVLQHLSNKINVYYIDGRLSESNITRKIANIILSSVKGANNAIE